VLSNAQQAKSETASLARTAEGMLRVSAFGLLSDFGLRPSDFTSPAITHFKPL
jgi:hypothetical protein